MNAIQVHQTGGPEVLQYQPAHPVPSPQEGQVLVQNSISGINYIDTYFRTGLYPSPKPEIPGREGVGHIVALGPGANSYNLQVGDRVAWLGTGGYAGFTAVPAAKTVKVPDAVRDEDVMAGFLSGLTVLTLVKETYPVQKGDSVLVHAAAGGAGSLMTQVLKAIGATVIATAGGPEKVELVKGLGADVVIDYRSENWVQRVRDVTGGRGVDVVYDSVGKDTWEGGLEVVKRKGTVVWFGNASGPVPPLPLQYVCSCSLDVDMLTVQETLPQMRQGRPSHAVRLHRDPRRIRVLRQRALLAAQERPAQGPRPQGVPARAGCAGSYRPGGPEDYWQAAVEAVG